MIPYSRYVGTGDYSWNNTSSTSTSTSTYTYYPYHFSRSLFEEMDIWEHTKLLRTKLEISGRKLIEDLFNNLELVRIKNMDFIISPLFKPKIVCHYKNLMHMMI